MSILFNAFISFKRQTVGEFHWHLSFAHIHPYRASSGPNHAVHQVRGSRQEDGRHKGPLQRRRHGQKCEPDPDAQAEPANGEDDGPSHPAANGRYAGPPQHDATAAAGLQRHEWPHGWEITLSGDDL